MKLPKYILLIILSQLILISCKNSGEKETLFEIQGEAGFVGTVDGTNAFIALLVAGDEAIVYVCNGDEQIAEWFRGGIDDPENIQLTNDAGATVNAQFSGNTFLGVVTLRNNLTHSFKAAPNNSANTGVFRVHGEIAAQDGVEAGWILNSDGAERGMLRISGRFTATPKMPPIKDIKDGTSNTLLINNKLLPIERFFLRRAGKTSFINMNG